MDQRGLCIAVVIRPGYKMVPPPSTLPIHFLLCCGGVYNDELHVFRVVFNHLRDTSDKFKPERILIDGKETGIDNLEFVYDGVKNSNLTRIMQSQESFSNGGRSPMTYLQKRWPDLVKHYWASTRTF
jgi:hypothetical protein